MRSSSGYSEILSSILLLAVVSCASAPPSVSRQDSFSLDGTIGVRGDQPFSRVIVLSDVDGTIWNLDPGSMEHELSLLDGFTVSMICTAAPEAGDERDARVEDYRIIPPEGMIAVRGRIVSENGGTSIVVAEGIGVVLEGPLADAVREYEGHRSWVWGEEGGRGKKLLIRGYEILGP